MGAAVVIPVAARHRAMFAADAVDVSTLRQAAILGGVVRSVIACNRINVPWVGQYTADIINAFNLNGVDRSPASLTEVAAVVERFQQSYAQPFSG